MVAFVTQDRRSRVTNDISDLVASVRGHEGSGVWTGVNEKTGGAGDDAVSLRAA